MRSYPPLPRTAFPATHGQHTQQHNTVAVSHRVCAPGLWRHRGVATRPCKLGARRKALPAPLTLLLASTPGGNCFDFIDSHGIRISQYGVHLFHTQARLVLRRQGSTWCQPRRCAAPPHAASLTPASPAPLPASSEQAGVGVCQPVERVDAVRAPVRMCAASCKQAEALRCTVHLHTSLLLDC